jgi:UDP-N-acetyl-D-galactosamine dehydrogenase
MGRTDVSVLAACLIESKPKHNRKVAVIGLGYVGLPLAVALGKTGDCVGYDVDFGRVLQLQNGCDRTGEMSEYAIQSSAVDFSNAVEAIAESDFYIVAVPTPVTSQNEPDLESLIQATKTVGSVLKKNDIVVYESTVFPGATEEVCGPILEAASGLKSGKDFYLAYSPERVNPGDSEHTLQNIVKVVSAQDESTLDIVAQVYGSVVSAGIYKVRSIKVAEAAKAIENTQRDLNIALMNELAIIFDRIGIDTQEVLEAAKTKWNFLPFVPGLVGGHCIGVDPYYLTHIAARHGYTPQVILAGRRINDSMGTFIAQKALQMMPSQRHAVILGLSFKENIGDIRNSRVPDIEAELRRSGVHVQICDPLACPQAAKKQYGINLVPLESLTQADCLIFAVPHNRFVQLPTEKICTLVKPEGVIIDVKSALDPNLVKRLGRRIWQL